MKIWYLLVDDHGKSFKNSSAAKVEVQDDADVADFKDAVYLKNSNDLSHCSAARLRVFEIADSDRNATVFLSSLAVS